MIQNSDDRREAAENDQISHANCLLHELVLDLFAKEDWFALLSSPRRYKMDLVEDQ